MSDSLNWRYATKKFDPTKKLNKSQLDSLMEALRLSPSSFGLQPWKFVVVENPSLRQELRKHAWNQDQITDAAVLIVLCAKTKVDAVYIKKFIATIAKTTQAPLESLVGYEKTMLGAMGAKTPEVISEWSKRQVYIALGMLLSACAQAGIDACPMEGFDPKKFDELLGLSQEGIESVVLCAVGYRSQDDHYANSKKVRFERKEVFIEK